MKHQCHRDSTRANYYSIWKHFNRFYIRLDEKPETWEHRLLLFVGHLIQHRRKSNTIKCYISAIKAILRESDYELQEDAALLGVLTKATKLHFDQFRVYLPICKSMLDMLLDSVDKFFADNPQPYLVKLYRAMISTTYYGLLRIGEVTKSDHVIKANDVYLGTNKNKVLFVLFSSKIHNKAMKPQTIKITELEQIGNTRNCPFRIIREYLEARPTLKSMDEQFFVFSDRSAVEPQHFRSILADLIKFNHLDPSRYRVHDLRTGYATDMLLMGVPIDIIKKIGRWKSSAVFKYLKA